MTGEPSPADQDPVPVSVRLGAVVPPEDAEDWRRPLTWVAAAGMLGAPAVALAWFLVAPPPDASAPIYGTWLVALALTLGAAAAGATQMGALRSVAGTLAAALFAALATVIGGVVTAGERQVGQASPTVAHAVAAALAGLAGALAAATLAPGLARLPNRLARWLVPGMVGAAVSLLVVRLLLPG